MVGAGSVMARLSPEDTIHVSISKVGPGSEGVSLAPGRFYRLEHEGIGPMP